MAVKCKQIGAVNMELTVKQVAEACGGRLLCGDETRMVRHISLNSNKMAGDDLFVPIIGERVDAHRFLSGAFSAGAVCALTSWKSPELLKDTALQAVLDRDPSAALIEVEDTRAALQALGRWYREKRVRIPLIGVTGSVGKTTTREMIACALSAGKRVYATKGNSNSQVGVPITVTETDADAEIGVIELGMSEFGEMSRISEVARVDAAVMTNIGISHINQLGTQENILIQKLHILDGMPDGAPLFLNGDDKMLCELTEEKIHAYGIAEGRRIPIIFYGTGENADWRAEKITLSKGLPQFVIRRRHADGSVSEYNCSLSVPGMHIVLNALASVAAAFYFGVDAEKASVALSEFHGVGGRGEIEEAGGIRIIDDSYNAAPASMKAGLTVLCDLPSAGRRVAVLADMLELGEKEAGYHREVGEFIRERKLPLDMLWLYGPLSVHIGEACRENKMEDVPQIRHFDSLEALSAALTETLKPGDTVLFKGSNGMGLKTAVSALLSAKREQA
ncbi:MAG: UDP-N-acetylmuramoyl-tripeptide--D-alanyl-D-alanine ligase [Eubacteriales bacterium]|nr:UDP-N-acetylmuramoyl-tripeptide--D-alanyl-D-alanine ligase [Eubacteriales bacterium]